MLLTEFATFRTAEVFNYSRLTKVTEMIEINNQDPVENNETFPWKTDDQGLGLHANIAMKSIYQYDIESHPEVLHEGMFFQFHSPLEYPSEKNPQFFGHSRGSLIFLVEPEITELGETLQNYDVEKYGKCLSLSEGI
jgi:hypothetical protein